MEVRVRALKFINNLKNPGNYLLFTHGGLMCALTRSFGFENVVPNCSAIALNINDEDFLKSDVIFSWMYPQIKML